MMKSQEIGKLQNNAKHVYNVQIALIDKKTIWVREDGKVLVEGDGKWPQSEKQR